MDKENKTTVVTDTNKNSSPIKKNTSSSSTGNIFLIMGLGCLVIVMCCVIMFASYIFFAIEEGSETSDTKISMALEDESTDGFDLLEKENGDEVEESELVVRDLGITKKAGDMDFTLHSVREEGNLVILDVEVKSNKTFRFPFSSLLIKLSNDSTNRNYIKNFAYTIPLDKSLDKQIEPGQSIRGEVAYSVYDNPDKMTIRMQNGFQATGEAEYSVERK